MQPPTGEIYSPLLCPSAAGPSTVCTLYNIIIVALIIARTRDPLQADGRGGGGGEGGAALLSMLRVTARTFTRDWCCAGT